MTGRDSLQQYRLRQLALQLRSFTVNELRAVAGVTSDTIHGFLHDLKTTSGGGSPIFAAESIAGAGPGRPVHRYTLTPEGVQLLGSKNRSLAEQFNNLAFQEDPTLKPNEVRAQRRVRQTTPPWFTFFEPELVEAFKCNAWSLLLKSGDVGAVRVGGRINSLIGGRTWTARKLSEFVESFLTPWQQERLRSKGWTACTYRTPEHGPLGLKVRSVGGEPEVEVCKLASQVPRIEDLHLSSLVGRFSGLRSGLVLVTGIGGSGKSTSIAAIIDRILETRSGIRIATIEEPILYFHERKQCFIEQRQIALDTPDYGPALNEALEEEADVLEIDDITGPEIFGTVLEAAERRLLLCRVPAPSVTAAIQKLVSLYDPSEHALVRARLSARLAGVIYLKALTGDSPSGTISAAEVVQVTDAGRELIADPEKIGSLAKQLSRDGHAETLDTAIMRLHQEGLITLDVATSHVSDKGILQSDLALSARTR